MSYYPLCLLQSDQVVAPLLGTQARGRPYVFDFSPCNPDVSKYDVQDRERLQTQIFEELSDSGRSWGMGRYLEDRRVLLENLPQFSGEQRFFHVGLDSIVRPGLKVFAPLAGRVFKIGTEAGQGNYGGYAILRHVVNGTVFYSFCGHLSSDHFVREGQEIEQGEAFGAVGQQNDAGGWFTHAHLQILTQEAVDKELMFRGYVSVADLSRVATLFPSPYALFRFCA